MLEYFISTHGARKGLADTALKTADAGYLTRRLVDVAQDVVVNQQDCGTINGVRTGDLKEGEEIIEPLQERIRGRVVQEDIYADGEIILKAGTLVDNEVADMLNKYEVDTVRIRSVLTCESKRGVCALCYGTDLSNNKLVGFGASVGIVAAQSIGEPGTQLTLRTFHIGGTAARIIEQSEMKSRRAGRVKYSENIVFAEVESEGEVVSEGKLLKKVLVRNSSLEIIDANNRAVSVYNVPYGADLRVKDGQKIKSGQVLFTWDPYTDVILARQSGQVHFMDMIEGETFQEEAVEAVRNR